MVVFMIVGKSEPLYEVEFSPSLGGGADYLDQFVLHSSLDMVQSAMWANNSTFLKVVDRFNALIISGFVTPGGTILLLLHNGKNEDAIKLFFTEVTDLYTKYLMNPFSIADSPIVSPQFDLLVRGLAKRLLSV